MIACESHRGRRIVGRLDRGQSLLDALAAVCKKHNVRAGGLRAQGALETVELASFDQETRHWRPSRVVLGPLDLVGLDGTISEEHGKLAVVARATLTRERETGLEVVAGQVVSAKIYAVEFVIEAFDDVILRRTTDTATGLSLWSEAITLEPESGIEPEPEPEPVSRSVSVSVSGSVPASPSAPAPAPAATSWAAVASASARLTEPDPDPSEPEVDDSLGPGDILMHPTFGRCEVQRIEGSYEYAHIRLKNGRLVRVSLDILKVVPAGHEGSRRVFKARVS
jgi:predicted DNA-binding protein with PD1-like motif